LLDVFATGKLSPRIARMNWDLQNCMPLILLDRGAGVASPAFVLSH
jgi:hypothetical protein